MTENTGNKISNTEYDALLANSYKNTNAKEKSIVSGTIVSIENDIVTIDVGLKSEGRISISEFSRPGQKPEINIGDQTEELILSGKSKFSKRIYPKKWQNDKFKERLKDTTILNEDFRKVIKKYDAPDTFFYLDPPYSRADKNKDYVETGVTIDDVYNAVKNIKGKFLLSYDDVPEAKKLFKNYNILRVPTKYQSGKGGITKKVCELLQPHK